MNPMYNEVPRIAIVTNDITIIDITIITTSIYYILQTCKSCTVESVEQNLNTPNPGLTKFPL